MPVLLYNADNTVVIAEGQVSAHLDDGRYDGINITSSRTVIDVLKVLVPGALVTSHAKRALNSFGPVPFSVVALRSHLWSFNPATSFHQESSNSPDPAILPSLSSAPLSLEEPEPSNDAAVPVGDLLTGALPDPSSLAPTDADNLLSVDAASAALGEKILGPEQEILHEPEFDSTIRSRVLKDPFHVLSLHGSSSPITFYTRAS